MLSGYLKCGSFSVTLHYVNDMIFCMWYAVYWYCLGIIMYPIKQVVVLGHASENSEIFSLYKVIMSA